MKLNNKRKIFSAGLSGLNNLSGESRLELEAAMLDGGPDRLRGVGLGVDEAHQLCTCVLERFNQGKRPLTTTTTTKTTSTATASAFVAVTTTATVTSDLTLTVVQPVPATPL